MSLERHGEGPSTFYTTSDLWECGCASNYVHIVLLDKCAVCGALRDESADARVTEIMTMSKVCRQSNRVLRGIEIL